MKPVAAEVKLMAVEMKLVAVEVKLLAVEVAVEVKLVAAETVWKGVKRCFWHSKGFTVISYGYGYNSLTKTDFVFRADGIKKLR